MGSKINLNINNEWEEQVLPILEEWKKEEGNFSDKVCESIVFMKQATASRIWDAIMAYDTRQEEESDGQPVLTEWEKQVIADLKRNLNPMFFLTKSPKGPLLTENKAKAAIRKLRALNVDVKPETEYEKLLRTYPPYKCMWGTRDFLKIQPEEAYETLQRLEDFVSHLRDIVDFYKPQIDAYVQAKKREKDEKYEAWKAARLPSQLEQNVTAQIPTAPRRGSQ